MIFTRLQRAIDSGLLSKSLCEVVAPASEKEISLLAHRLEGALSAEHAALLREWGGSNLDEIRIASASEVIARDGRVTFASDYNGYVFSYDMTGDVFATDTDGGEVKLVAPSVGSFINDVFLGLQAQSFYGESWLQELRTHGLA